MPLTHDERWHAAVAIRSRLIKRRREAQRRSAGCIAQAVSRAKRLDRVAVLLDHAIARGWQAACRRLTQEARRLFDALTDDGRAFERTLKPETPVPTLRTVCEEIAQAEVEFVELKYDRARRVLTAVTTDIELEDVHLGPFGIELHLAHLDEPASPHLYTVEALDPHPARSDGAVTHPHVRDGGLCAGEAVTSIAAALGAGRVCDFFLVVRSVLETYNPSSPYVTLADWGGEPCVDCDVVVPSDDLYYCTTCDSALCDHCACSCAWCEEFSCRSCLDKCPECERLVCGDCMTTCPDCERTLCKACLKDGCPCTEETDDDGHNDDESGGRRPATQAVQAVFRTA